MRLIPYSAELMIVGSPAGEYGGRTGGCPLADVVCRRAARAATRK
jgi:hypothetical protein